MTLVYQVSKPREYATYAGPGEIYVTLRWYSIQAHDKTIIPEPFQLNGNEPKPPLVRKRLDPQLTRRLFSAQIGRMCSEHLTANVIGGQLGISENVVRVIKRELGLTNPMPYHSKRRRKR